MKQVCRDVTLELSPETVVYPGDAEVCIREVQRISRGDTCNVSAITLSSHAGTHMDAPRHFVENGQTVDELPLDYFLGKARVVCIDKKGALTAADLARISPQKNERLLLKTGNSALLSEKKFVTSYTYLEPCAARLLADAGIRTLGFDYLSVEKYGAAEPEVHRILLGSGIVIIEGLVLQDVSPGEYELTALPLRLAGCDGSPVRAVLREL
ncbi:MAG: cyclase family protein [Bacillota bacterium]